MEQTSFKSRYTMLATSYGIGTTRATKLLGLVGLMNRGSKEQLEQRLNMLREILIEIGVGYRARSKVLTYVMNLKRISCYRGLRATAGLPIRGQRTHTNANTSKFLIKTYSYLDLEVIKQYHSIDIQPTKRVYTNNKTKRRKSRVRAKKPKMYDTNLFKNKSLKKKDRMPKKKNKADPKRNKKK